ncbi:MAG: hypothetical protein Q9160_005423 [Pyrenula sp. 1 TL-2023]
MNQSTNPFVVLPTSRHTHTIIFLHGRGSNAAEFASEIFESQASDRRLLTEIFPGIKWVFPDAPRQWSKIEQTITYQWFDIVSVQQPNQHKETQEPGLKQSVGIILDILKTEAEDTKITMDRIFLADDYVVPVTSSEILKEGLVGLGMQVELKRYDDGEHWLQELRGVDDMVAFIRKRIEAWKD